MKEIKIEEAMNGWKVDVKGFSKVNGPYVFTATEILRMITFLGDHINGRKVTVVEK